MSETKVMIDVPMPIQTPRLLLRPVRAGDGAGIAEAVRETWDDLSQWMPWTDQDPSPAANEARAREGEAKFILREDLWMVGIERATQRPVMWTGLHRFNWETRRFEIGYWVRESAQRKGFATEATNALIRFAFGALAARRVEISHAAQNTASQGVIAKLGFEREGVFRDALLLPGKRFADEVRYARRDMKGLPALKVSW